MPSACSGWTFPLGIPKIGSAAWCQAEESILKTIRDWGLKLLDWLIGIADKIEKWGWDTAQAAIDQIATNNSMIVLPEGSLFTAIGEALQSVWGFLANLFQYAKQGFGYVIYGLAYGIKALACMLRAAQADPTYIDYTTVVGVWTLRYVWKTVKGVRISSPDFLGLQFVGADLVDWFDQVLYTIENSVTQMKPPSEVEAMECYLTNTITDQMFNCWLRINDKAPEVYFPVVQSRREQLTTVEQVEAVRRTGIDRYGAPDSLGFVTAAEIDRENRWIDQSIIALRNVGWINSSEAAAEEALFDEIPTISDHIHWLARNVDDMDYVATYHLLDGFEDPAVVVQMLGPYGAGYTPLPVKRNFWETFGLELRAQGKRKIDSARDYIAHWLHASPGQMREFVWRLRPGRTPSPWDHYVEEQLALADYTPDLIAKATTFTPKDFTRLLNEQDYAYLDVGWFLSTLYHVPALSYIRDMYRYGVINDAELKSYHQDLGYSDLDSERFLGVDALIKKRIRTAEAFGWTPSALSRALGLKLIKPEDDSMLMKEMGFSDGEISNHQSRAAYAIQERIMSRALGRVFSQTIQQATAAYRDGVLTWQAAQGALQNLGVPEAQASAIMEMTDLKYRSDNVKKTTTLIRKAFLKGKLNVTSAADIMTQMGLAQPWIQSQLAYWNVQLLELDKQSTVADIKRWTCEGLIPPAEALTRLNNLHVPDGDMQLILAEIQICKDKLAAKEAAYAEKQQLQLEKQAASAAKEAVTVAHKALSQTMRIQSPSVLRKWLKDGIVTPEYFASRLASYYYDPTTIFNSLADIIGAAAAATVTIPPSPPPLAASP
jgi:hypothetical protein